MNYSLDKTFLLCLNESKLIVGDCFYGIATRQHKNLWFHQMGFATPSLLLQFNRKSPFEKSLGLFLFVANEEAGQG